MQELKENMSSCGRNSTLRKGDVKFVFHSHRYFPYEHELAKLEIEKVLKGEIIVVTNSAITAKIRQQKPQYKKLTYFSQIRAGQLKITTAQHLLEQGFRNVQGRRNRQSTRYSVHGIHEYKGKFNPQLARFILNYFGAEHGDLVLDPFCGSGTTLIEAAFQKIGAVGIDMNPMAIFLTRAKHMALAVCADDLEKAGASIIAKLNKSPKIQKNNVDTRLAYLFKWFPDSTLQIIEHLRSLANTLSDPYKYVLLALSSDLIREYSLQEPADLRIRRRKSPFPSISFQNALRIRLASFCASIRSSQEVLGYLKTSNKAICGDARSLSDTLKKERISNKFDFVVTSPPYATALPYIDTQRLSLVWLGLCSAKEIAELDADAVGSRELKGASAVWSERLLDNADLLPNELAHFCRSLFGAVSKTDGFRRKAAPMLIYRYYADMRRVFIELHKLVKNGAQLGFVVGSNHTTLGGRKFVINTPNDLALIAIQSGFKTKEVIKLDTYQRYGLHARNAVNSENLTIYSKK